MPKSCADGREWRSRCAQIRCHVVTQVMEADPFDTGRPTQATKPVRHNVRAPRSLPFDVGTEHVAGSRP